MITIANNALIAINNRCSKPKPRKKPMTKLWPSIAVSNKTSKPAYAIHKSEIEVISSHLANLNFSHDEMNHAISDLSGGQKGKLLLLYLVLESPQLLILDEPTRNFSPTSQPQVRQLFENYPGAILTVSHDVNYLRQVCQKIYRLDAHGLEEVEI